MIPDMLSAGNESWQMTNGERMAYEGTLAFVRPTVAVEVGSAMGGSLERTAAYAGHVHSFDLVEPGPKAKALVNVTFHTGDSHDLLAPWLDSAFDEDRMIDFAHIDGDHSAAGVARDITDLLKCPAFDGVMLLHDVMNPSVRDGLDLVHFDRFPNVAYVDYDFVPGHLTKRRGDGAFRELWGGIALVVVDRSHRFRIREGTASRGIRQDRFYDLHRLVRPLSVAGRLPARGRSSARFWSGRLSQAVARSRSETQAP